MNGIVYGQFSTRDNKIEKDSIFYTDKQDARCLQCLDNEVKKDTILNAQKRNIERLKESLKIKNEEVLYFKKELEVETKISKDLSLDLSDCLKSKKRGVIISFSVGLVGGIVFMSLVK